MEREMSSPSLDPIMDTHDRVQKRATESQSLNHSQTKGAFTLASVSTLSSSWRVKMESSS